MRRASQEKPAGARVGMGARRIPQICRGACDIRSPMLIRGKCHCGNIAFSLVWKPDPTEIPARACTCSFCVKHGGVWTSNPAGRLEVVVKDPSRVSNYAFGTRTAEFHVCARCGVVPVVTSRIDDHLYAVVSVNAFEDVAPSLLNRRPASFDGEGTDSRLARRKRGWIADVRYLEHV
jgi:hypothetical protein